VGAGGAEPAGIRVAGPGLQATTEAFSQLNRAAFGDFGEAVRRVERVLRALVEYQRINYLMLMMVERDVHFQVLPRYEGARSPEGLSFPDEGWPEPPKPSPAVELPQSALPAPTERLTSLRATA
jgi:diadenosine tetraphosphate (Ap4A) HIT family hydrolase